MGDVGVCDRESSHQGVQNVGRRNGETDMQSTEAIQTAAPDLLRPAQGRIIWGSPLILYTSQLRAAASFLNSIGDLLGDRKIIFLPLVAWTMETMRSDDWMIQKIRSYEKRYPNHRIIHMCNTQKEVDILRACGCEAEWFNHNVFVDPELISPIAGAAKDFDAVYNAQLEPWKRHRLARQIPSLALMYHSFNSEQAPYQQSLRAEVPQAFFANHELSTPPGGELNRWQVREVLNRSRVGLCLSETEGAMYASVEYLLAGLPVVSTFNRGGRDQFMHPDFWLSVPPDPAAIAQACRELIKRRLDPNEIRARTIAHQQREIARFQVFVNGLIAEAGVDADIRPHWPKIYRDKLGGWASAGEFLSEVEAWRPPEP